MRKCGRCETAMADLKLTAKGWELTINHEEKVRHLGKVRCAVCPLCGEISLYVDDLSRLRKHLDRSGGTV